MKKLIMIVSLLIFCGSLFSQKLLVIESKNLKCNDSVLVFTPKNYSATSIEPTAALFLLHGWSGDYSNWSKKCDLQTISDKYNFIIICPDGFYNSWYLNNVDSTKMQWRTFFDNELYPLIQKKYNIVAQKTFITGLSMGGHGAINIFIDDPSRFRAAGSMSGVLNLQSTRLKKEQISKILSPYSEDNKLYDQESAINRLDKIKESQKLLIITSGAQDIYSVCSSEFCKRADELNIPNILMLSPGKHSWTYWLFALDQHLYLFSKIINNQNMGY